MEEELSYFRSGDVIVITIRDYSGAKIETLRCNAKDKKKYSSIISYLKEKYGMDFVPTINRDDWGFETSL